MNEPISEAAIINPAQTPDQDQVVIDRFSTIPPEELFQEILALSSSLETTEEIQPALLRNLVSSARNRSNELFSFLNTQPEVQAALAKLEEEWQRREGKLSSFVQVTEEVSEETQVQETISSAEVREVQRTEQGLEITVADKETGEEKQILVQEKNLWANLLILVASDLLLGTHSTSELTTLFLNYQVTAPVLSKLGISNEDLFAEFGSEKYRPFDEMLKGLNDQSCEQYFKEATEKDFLYEVLSLCDPEHLHKIFDPTGTKPFGSSGLFTFDHLHLSPELVKRMYEKLTPQQREYLKIPHPVAVFHTFEV